MSFGGFVPMMRAHLNDEVHISPISETNRESEKVMIKEKERRKTDEEQP